MEKTVREDKINKGYKGIFLTIKNLIDNFQSLKIYKIRIVRT